MDMEPENIMSVETFLEEFTASTEPNPFANHERVWEWHACFDITRSSSHEQAIMLRVIRSLQRGKGYGSAALKWLCALADEHQVILCGYISPVGTQRPRMTKRQLTQWYRRYGFIIGSYARMARHPVNTGENNACKHLCAGA